MTRQPGPRSARLLLFFSGTAALIYQAVWIKQLGLVVGIDVFAVSIGVSGFFAGLAIGAVAIGRIADSSIRPLRLYAIVEIGIAAAAVLATLALANSAALFVALQDSMGAFAWLLPLGLVMAPATLMGGTLPPLLATVKPDDGEIGEQSGRLYAANTAGAIVGAIATILLVVPLFGVLGAALCAASLNLVLAAVAFAIDRRSAALEPAAEETPKPAKRPEGAILALSLYAIAGGVALGYEVVWTQVIVQFLSTRAVAFSMVLSTYLLGLAAGSWMFARAADRFTERWTVFGWLIAGAGLAAVLSFTLLGAWLPALQDAVGGFVNDATGNRMLEMVSRFAVAAAFLILPSTLLLGAAFPAAARLIVSAGHASRDVGLVLALNTVFGIAGTLLTGFLLVPSVGLASSLGILAFIAACIGAVAILRQASFTAAGWRYALPLVAVALAGAWFVPRDRLATLLADARGGEVVFYDEGPAGTVAVIEQDTPRGSFRRLYIQGVSNSGDVMPSKRYMRLQALLPLLIQEDEPKSAMVIAFGTGITAGALLAHPGLERRVVVELLEPVVDAAPLFDGNFGAGTDPRLEVVIADGRHELMRRDERFDLITLEPPPPAAAGVVNLYSRDFYELAAERLEDDGMLAQWLPIATQNEEDTRSLVRSMLDVFPHVSLWTTEVHEMMLVGSSKPLALDFLTIAKRMQDPGIDAALTEVGVDSAADLLATYITDRSGLEDYAGDAPPVTDDRPRIEYAPWVRPREILRSLPSLLALARPVPVDATRAQNQAIQRSYEQLLSFYEAAYRSYANDTSSWSERRIDAQRAGANAYYDWFFTAGRD